MGPWVGAGLHPGPETLLERKVRYKRPFGTGPFLGRLPHEVQATAAPPGLGWLLPWVSIQMLGLCPGRCPRGPLQVRPKRPVCAPLCAGPTRRGGEGGQQTRLAIRPSTQLGLGGGAFLARRGPLTLGVS